MPKKKADKSEENKEIQEVTEAKEVVLPKKSKKLVHIDEFSIQESLRVEHKEGLKAFVKGTEFLSLEDWKKNLDMYLNRKL